MLHTLADHLEVVWGALLAAAIVVLLTPAVGGMARLLGAVDRPEDVFFLVPPELPEISSTLATTVPVWFCPAPKV